MSAQVESVAGQTTVNEGKGAIASFFDTVLSTITLILMAVGLVTLTLTWRTSDLEFQGNRELKITQSTWWGFHEEVTQVIVDGPEGWTIQRANGDRVPLSRRSVRLRN